MSLTNWITVYVADLMFWIWIFFIDGAEMLGNTFISGIFTFLVTLRWRELNAEGIKLFGCVVLSLHTFFFVLGIVVPPFRTFFG